MAAGRRNQTQTAHLIRCCMLLVLLVAVPDFIVALKDVAVSIPQAVKRGSNALLICNYDMENDTLYSVKWYKGRREFYRYTPKENPAMKVFPITSGLSVERNLSNQSHVVLLAVPLNISGKFTCEISVEAPSFQTAMVSGEMEVVELPEQQAIVTGIQPRYRIGDLVDGNCSIKFSKPAANLTWTINGVVVSPHHIKTYQIEKYEDNNLESVVSAVHFMVTTTHFLKGQMRLKCTASIFDIFKEEIENVIEEDRPRIMASGRSYDINNYPYEHQGSGDGFEDHNESYLTYYSAASTATRTSEIFLYSMQKRLQRIWSIMYASTKAHVMSLAQMLPQDVKRCIAIRTQSAFEEGSYRYNRAQTNYNPALSVSIIIAASTVLGIILAHHLETCQNSKKVELPATASANGAGEHTLLSNTLSKVATEMSCRKSLYNCQTALQHSLATTAGLTVPLQDWQQSCYACNDEENQNGIVAQEEVTFQRLSWTLAAAGADAASNVDAGDNNDNENNDNDNDGGDDDDDDDDVGVNANAVCSFAGYMSKDQTLLMTEHEHEKRHFRFDTPFNMATALLYHHC